MLAESAIEAVAADGADGDAIIVVPSDLRMSVSGLEFQAVAALSLHDEEPSDVQEGKARDDEAAAADDANGEVDPPIASITASLAAESDDDDGDGDGDGDGDDDDDMNDEDDDDDDGGSKRALRRWGLISKSVGRSLYERATWKMHEGKFAEAADLFAKIADKERQRHGPTHAAVGSALHNLALANVKQQKYQQAVAPCEEAVRVRQEVLREDSLDTASSLVLLGTIYDARKQGEDALRSFRRALIIRRKRLGENNPAVASLYNHLGNVLFEEQEYLASLMNFEDALAIHQLSPKSNQEQGEILSNIGTIRIKRKEYEKASEAFEQSLDVLLLEYREGHPQIMYALDCLAYSLAKDGRLRESLRVYKKILRGQISHLGASHGDCGETLTKMAAIYEQMDKIDDAIECAKNALSIMEKAHGHGSPEVARARKLWIHLEKDVGEPSSDAASM